jgi:hypothetical protein
MLRINCAALSLLVALTLSVLASSTALAATNEFVVNGSTIAKGEKVEVNLSETSISLFETVVAGTHVNIECQYGVSEKGSTALEGEGKAKSTIELEGCSLTTVSGGVSEGLPKCKIKGGVIKMKLVGELFEAGNFVFETPSKESAGTVTIEEVSGAGACGIAGTFSISEGGEGFIYCEIPRYANDVTVISLECLPGGPLKFGKEELKDYIKFGMSGTKGQKIHSS